MILQCPFEYEQYNQRDFCLTSSSPRTCFLLLMYWGLESKREKFKFPVLSRIAMDILSVQALRLVSESAFQLDHLDAQERKQDTSPLELPLDVEEGVFNVEVQQNKATQLNNHRKILR
ncbi:zinc finger BED domain-containing protein RICESLEEPER 2-like protein [Tanacetum coccineum]